MGGLESLRRSQRLEVRVKRHLNDVLGSSDVFSLMKN